MVFVRVSPLSIIIHWTFQLLIQDNKVTSRQVSVFCYVMQCSPVDIYMFWRSILPCLKNTRVYHAGKDGT